MVAIICTARQWVQKGIPFRRARSLIGSVGLLGMISFGLAACGASSNLASNFGLKTANDSKKASISRPIKSVAFTPLIGAPAHISARMLSAMKTATRAKNLPVTEEIAKAGYLVRGNLSAVPQKTGAKLSYIWDINNSRGVRVHRILGSEIIPGKKTNNGWSLVNDRVIARVTTASSNKLATWFANGGRAPVNRTPDLPGGAPKTISPIAKNMEGTPGDPIITGAVSKRTVHFKTRVSPIKGAPGDGRISLTNALRQQLKRNGIDLSSQKVAGGYTVQGQVKLSRPKSGRQIVRITWNVYDGKGTRVGTVSQKNEVPAGSLNGAWGPTAEAAASAAAKGIIKLLPGKHS